MPQIMPFNFGEESANAGDFITAQCAVTKGDSPIIITWRFNNSEIISSDGIMISMRGRRISDMTIEAVRAEHSGAYTCVASNAAGSVNLTSYLHVNGTHCTKSRTCMTIARTLTPTFNLFNLFYSRI